MSTFFKGKNIWFISGSVPRPNSTSSDIVFFRHLVKLEEKGARINLLLPQSSFHKCGNLPPTWNILVVPERKWWFPPYRNIKVLKLIRYNIYFYGFVRKALISSPGSIVLGYIWGTFMFGLDAFIAKKLNLPFFLFYHDDQKSFLPQVNRQPIYLHEQWVIKQCRLIWTVSRRLIFNSDTRNKHMLLPPIPGSFYEEVPAFDPHKKTIVYSGLINAGYIELFERIAGMISPWQWRLIVITANSLIPEVNKVPNLTYSSFFDQTVDLIKFLRENAAAILVAYPALENQETTEWMKSCFPSKFVEFTQLAIPIIALAPKDTAFGEWCITNNWELFLEQVDGIAEVLHTLERPEEWEKQSLQTKNAAQHYFNPEQIQAAFEQSIIDNYSNQ